MSITAISPVSALAPQLSQHRPPVRVEALPDMPKPLTPATAAVHLMQVPSSRVLEVLASLQRAIGQQTPINRASDDSAQRLARAVAPLVSGSKVNVQV